MDPEQVRDFALALPHVEQYEHGGCPSFRVHGKRFANMLDADGVNIALDEHQMRIALHEWPAWCRPELTKPRADGHPGTSPERSTTPADH